MKILIVVYSFTKPSNNQRTSSNPLFLASETVGINGPKLLETLKAPWPSGQFLKIFVEHFSLRVLGFKVAGLMIAKSLVLAAVLIPRISSVEMWLSLTYSWPGWSNTGNHD
jgi:hypothetical protein